MKTTFSHAWLDRRTKGVPWRTFLPVAFLLIAGLAMRVLGSWCYEFTQKADHGIVCLMVKHMVEGKGFPVFYYGQAYLGSLEPAVSAALCRLFGLSAFWINLGTALVAWAFLPLVYFWGRGAAGRTGGLAALAFCVIGPPAYFQFEGWAYGGYAAIPLLTCAVLAVSLLMLGREMRGESNSHAHFLLLGVIAGLGWWQSPLLIPAFITSALLFLAVMRLRLFTLRLFSGAAGFFLGSAPLWVWNARHQWQTFNMLSTEHRPSFVEGLRLFYGERLPELLEFPMLPPASRAGFAVLLVLLVILALVRWIRLLRIRSRERALYLGAAVVYALLLSVLFTQSRYAKVHALRYTLVMIPVLGILVGAATAWLTERTRWGLGWLPLLALVALQAGALPMHVRERDQAAKFVGQARELAAFLRAQGIRHIYTEYQRYRASHGLNFLLDEEFVFSAHAAEKVGPYKRAMELSDRPAVLNDLMKFDSFLALTRGTAASYEIPRPSTPYDRISLRYAIEPPPANARPVPPAEWSVVAVVTNGAHEALPALKDGACSPTWRSPAGKGLTHALRIHFPRPRRIVGLRLLCPEPYWPASIGVERWDAANRQWVGLQPDTACTRYFWSGPRFYWGGDAFRLECRFDPVETARLKVRVTNPLKYNVCEIAEIQVLEETDHAPAPGGPELDQLAGLIRERGIRRVYADRWEANMVYARSRGTLRLSLAPGILESEVLFPAMTLDGATALVVRKSEADMTRQALAVRGLSARETVSGPWVVFDFPGGPAMRPLGEPGLRWAGFGCLVDGEWKPESALPAAGN